MPIQIGQGLVKKTASSWPLRDNVIHVKIVIATAMMAIARKVIILDLDTTPAEYLWGIALIVVAMSVAYLVVQRYGSDEGGH